MASGDEFGSRSKIPIRLHDFSVLGTEFDNIRSRFDSEMKKMEEDMNKFRSEMLVREGPFIGSGKGSSFSTTKR